MRSRLLLALLVVVMGAVSAALAAPALRDDPPSTPVAVAEDEFAYRVDGALRRAQAAGVGREPRDDQQHVHAAVRLIVDGIEYHPPRDVGLVDAGALLAIHTHDASGVVHMHQAKGARPFTLGQLFAVWGIQVDGSGAGEPRTWINGRPRPLSMEVPLTDHADVVVEAGTAGAEADRPPVAAFDFDSAPIR